MGLLQALLGFKRSKVAAELADERRQRMHRLQNPDWGFYEKHLQRPVPAALKRLFANASLVGYSGKPLESGEIYVTAFEPIDQQAVVDSEEWLGFEVVPFASSDGDLIYFHPGPLEADRVYITYHDGGDTEVLAESADAFLSAVEAAGGNAI
jgi:hypothetical protein